MKFRSERAKAKYFETYNRFEGSWPVAFESRVVRTSPYGSTYVRVSGSECAPPLVLLPAAHSNSLIWTPCIAALARRYRIYAVDPIFSHGKSVLESRVSTVAELIGWLDSLLYGLELEDINLCGMSLGGWISSRYALTRPHKIRRLALLAPAATFLRIRPEFLARGIVASTVPIKGVTESFSKWLMTIDGGVQESSFRETGAFSALMNASAKAYKVPIAYPVPSKLSDQELRRLSGLGPMLLIGKHDQMYSVEKALARIRRVAPDIDVQTLAGAGHSFIRSHPQDVSQKLQGFFG